MYTVDLMQTTYLNSISSISSITKSRASTLTKSSLSLWGSIILYHSYE